MAVSTTGPAPHSTTRRVAAVVAAGALAIVAATCISTLTQEGLGPFLAKVVGWSTPAPGPRTRSDIAADIAAENTWKNSLVLGSYLATDPASPLAALPRPVVAWLRSYLAGVALYFGVGGLWAYYTYWVFGDVLFPKPGSMPSRAAVAAQVRVAMGALPLYAALPAAVEAAAEAGLTRAYTRIGTDAGGALPYWALFVAYMAVVEWGVYWAHRGLHDWRAGYDALHARHHIYNKEHTLSPFAGLAFHPLDGIAQATPYALALFLVPCHFLTHELLLFATAVWTANIHDALDGRASPVMGAGYHTIHHTTYKHNYGQYFIYADAAHGTLVTPAQYAAGKRRPKSPPPAADEEADPSKPAGGAAGPPHTSLAAAVHPPALLFAADSGQQEQGRSLTISNPSPCAAIAFKIRTSNPASYAVDVGSGVLPPLGERRVRVFRLAGAADGGADDVFCVSSSALPPDTPLPEAASAALTGRLGEAAVDVLIPVVLAAGDAGGPPPEPAALAAAVSAATGGRHSAAGLRAFATLLASRGLITPDDLAPALAAADEVARRAGAGASGPSTSATPPARPPPTPALAPAQQSPSPAPGGGEEEGGDGGGRQPSPMAASPPIQARVVAFSDRIKMFEAGFPA